MEFRLILKKINNTLNKEEKQEFQQWYEASSEHREYYERIERAFEKEEFKAPLTRDAWNKIDERLFTTNRKRSRWWAAAAAVLVLLITLPFFFQQNEVPGETVVTTVEEDQDAQGVVIVAPTGKRNVISDQETVEGEYYTVNNNSVASSNGEKQQPSKGEETGLHSVIVPRGRQFNIELADGTKIWLNSETKINFPASFKNAESRIVEMEYGEAYFEVASSDLNQGKSFIVDNKGQRIEVLGTTLNVNAYPESRGVVTTLVEGSVRLSTSTNSLELIPGQQAFTTQEDAEIAVRQVDVGNVVGWKDGKYVFQDEQMGAVMMVIERWFNVLVSFEGKEAEKAPLNGVLHKTQSLEEIIEILENTNKADFELNGSSIKVMDKKEGNGV